MSWTRRQFLTVSSLVIAGGTLRGVPLLGQQQPPPETAFTPIRNDVGIFTGNGGTIGWYIAPDGVVVVDAQFPNTAEICLNGIRERTDRKIDVLINTHHHGDHTSGNGVFRPATGRIVAHARVPDLQKKAAAAAQPPMEAVVADTTFEQSWKEAVGKETIVAQHYGPAHTAGDAAILFQNANVVHMGDLMFNRVHPFVDRPGGASIQGWIGALEKIAEQHGNDATYIFGHANPKFGVTGSRADLMVQRDYFTAVLDHVRKGRSAGQSREEIMKLEQLPNFPDHVSPIPLLSLSGVLGAAYDELSA